MKDLLLAAAMVAGRVAPAFTQPAATDQTGDDGLQTKAHIESHCFVSGVSAVRLRPTYIARVRERGA